MVNTDNLFEVTVYVEDFEEQVELKFDINNDDSVKQLKENVTFLILSSFFSSF